MHWIFLNVYSSNPQYFSFENFNGGASDGDGNDPYLSKYTIHSHQTQRVKYVLRDLQGYTKIILITFLFDMEISPQTTII